MLTISWIHQMAIVINRRNRSFSRASWASRTSCFGFALLLSSNICWIHVLLSLDYRYWFPFIAYTIRLVISIWNWIAIGYYAIITATPTIATEFALKLRLFTRRSCWCSLKINNIMQQQHRQRKTKFSLQCVRALLQESHIIRWEYVIYLSFSIRDFSLFPSLSFSFSSTR